MKRYRKMNNEAIRDFHLQSVKASTIDILKRAAKDEGMWFQNFMRQKLDNEALEYEKHTK